MKIKQLKQEIGEELFNQLSKEDKDFMVEIMGSIDFGYSVDLVKILGLRVIKKG